MDEFNKFFNKHRWLIIGILSGLILGICILCFGFFKVLFVVLITAAIGGLGYLHDKDIKLGYLSKRLFGRRDD